MKEKNEKHLTSTRARKRRKTRNPRIQTRAFCAESSLLLVSASRERFVRDNLPSGRADSKAHIRRSDEAARVELFTTRTSCDRQTKIVSRQRRERTATFARGCHIRCANRRCVVKKVVSLLATPQIGISTQQHTSFQIS